MTREVFVCCIVLVGSAVLVAGCVEERTRDGLIMAFGDAQDAYWRVAPPSPLPPCAYMSDGTIIECDHPPMYPIAALPAMVEACVNVAYIIESDGSTRDGKVLKTMLSKPAGPDITADFVAVALRGVESLEYEPTGKNPGRQPVLTNTIIDFSIDERVVVPGSGPPAAVDPAQQARSEIRKNQLRRKCEVDRRQLAQASP